jgi:curved DNA-binding protein CbpA
MTTERPDLYAILGVAPDATQAEISHAYRSLLRQHHPDTRAPIDEPQDAVSDQALQHVLAAYAVLRDPTRRADYDREVRSLTRPVARRSQQPPNRHSTHRQPPIVAGPVRWHRAPDPPTHSETPRSERDP